MARPGGTRHMGGGAGVSGHRIGGGFQPRQTGMFQGGRPGGTQYRGTLPSQRTGGGLGMGGLSGPIIYEMGRQIGRREARGGYGNPPGGHGNGIPGGMPPGGGTTAQANGNRGCSPGCLTALIIVFALLLIASLAGSYMVEDSGSGSGKSTIERHKLTDIPAYDSDCIADQLGWLDSITQTEKDLKNFYDETGIQPYVILKAYDASLSTDSEKEAWAKAYFDQYIDRENAFLVVYFGEANADYDMGYMAQVSGAQAKSIMDSEALDIFWNNIDRYWTNSNYTLDQVLTKTYSDTASTIMRVSTTSKDIAKWLIIAGLVIGILVALFLLLKERNRRAKEKAEETERILKTPLETYSDKEHEDLINRYGDGANASTDTSSTTQPASSQQQAPDIKLSQDDTLRTATDDLIDKYKDS